MESISTGIFDVAIEERAELDPPRWALDCVADALVENTQAGSLHIRVQAAARASLVTVRVADAVHLSADEFERATIDAYAAIRSTLAALAAHEPVRFWNHLPAIHQAMDATRDRYMVFNGGRFLAFASELGGAERFDGRIPTASGVGHRGSDLVIHCLAATQPGRAVENPRQVPAFRYSRRYGPRPPCFSRATVVGDLLPGGAAVLIGGTASICGERSVHQDELTSQIEETLNNLAALIDAARAKTAATEIATPVVNQKADAAYRAGDFSRQRAAELTRQSLSSFTDLRVYYPRPADPGVIARRIAGAFGVQPQLMQADLCRAELLVEIEGVARLGE